MKAVLLACALFALSVPECAPEEPELPPTVPLSIGRTADASITDQDHECQSLDPCRAFELRLPHAGEVTVSLSWPDKTTRLRLEVWNGASGKSTCCRAGERVSFRASDGDVEAVRVVLVSRPRPERQDGVWKTAFALDAQLVRRTSS